MNIILASSSPRRKELLAYLGYNFEIFPADINEDLLYEENHLDYVKRMSEEKGKVISNLHPEAVVISADTIVVLKQKVLGKPVDKKDSQNILSQLSGNTHEVFTAFSVLNSNQNLAVTKIIQTLVTFKNLSRSEIDAYVETGEGLDKAGAYGFQARGMSLISKIEGSPSNVVGLPLVELAETLRSLSL